MVVADVRPHELYEMALAENHNVLEELAPAAADPSFGGPVLPRAAVGGANRLRAHRFDEPDHGSAEDGVSVADEISRRRIVGKRLT